MILKTCLEITTFRCVFMHSVLFCSSSSSCSVFSVLVRNIGYSLESSIFSKQEKVFLHVCPSPSSTQLYLCPMRFCSHFVHFGGLIKMYSLPILELLFYSYIELGILKIFMSGSRFRGLCLDSMSSMMFYIWARNRGILN